MILRRDSPDTGMGSTTHSSFGDCDQSSLSPDKIIAFTRSPRRPPEFKPRSHSPTRLPGGLRVSVLQKPTPRLRPRIEESLAGLAELKMLREKQLQRIQDAKLTTNDHGQQLDVLHVKDKELSLLWHSPGNLSSISEEEVPVNRNNIKPETENKGIYLNGTEDGSSLSRNSYASNNSLDSLDSDVSSDEQKAEKSLSDDGVGRKLSSFKGYQSVNLQMTYPDPRYLGQRRASTQCIPQSNLTGHVLSDKKVYQRQRRASFQCEAVLTKSRNEDTSSKIISDMKLNYNSPGPLHAVMRQYGSSSNLSHKSTPSLSSTSLNIGKLEAKNPMDVLRDWELEKTKDAENTKTAASSQQVSTQNKAQIVSNSVCQEKMMPRSDKGIKSNMVDEAEKENNNENKVCSSSESEDRIKANAVDNGAEEKQRPKVTKYLNTDKDKEKANVINRRTNISTELSVSTSNFDHIREQSFTSDYYGSIETIHSVQSLPVSRVPSSNYKQSTSSAGSTFKDQFVSSNRRHSLPCNSSKNFLSTPSRTRSQVHNLPNGVTAPDFARKPNSTRALKVPNSSLDTNLRASSGNLSCGDDDVFDNTKTTTTFDVQRQQTTAVSADVSGEETINVLKESISRKCKPNFHQTTEQVWNLSAPPPHCSNKRVPDNSGLQNTQTYVTKATADEGYVASVSSRENSYEDLIGGEIIRETGKLTDVNGKTNSDIVEIPGKNDKDSKDTKKVVTKTFLETTL
ncbi:uncharacterized protein LOC132553479 [Ylistrum balloti]|uniref:uncharacterized protein LOC132553479 n=1 Tax=Ylistrum balloti TaxID=509963 RepID=UPI002905C094|nr:uncharacterized protein LOC132553479 [Ylistrum balloti]